MCTHRDTSRGWTHTCGITITDLCRSVVIWKIPSRLMLHESYGTHGKIYFMSSRSTLRFGAVTGHKHDTHTRIRHQHTNSGCFHSATHSTQALSISALTIGSLCWAGWDVRMNQCEDSWLDMPIHLPKKRKRGRGGKTARDSERKVLNPWSMYGSALLYWAFSVYGVRPEEAEKVEKWNQTWEKQQKLYL